MAAPSKKSLALFVSKIPWTVARKDLGEYFGQFGIVTWCKLPFSKETGFHKGHGWIAFKTEEGRDSALQKDLHVVEGATCTSAMYYYTKSCRCRESAYQSAVLLLYTLVHKAAVAPSQTAGLQSDTLILCTGAMVQVYVQSYRDRQRFVINKSNGDTQHD